MPSEEKAKRLIDRQIANPKRYWRKFGLLASPTCPQPEAADSCESVWSSWNTLIGEGLLSYGYRQLAADLVIRLMDGITKNLKKEGGFRQLHHAVTGDGLGERDTLSGLPPLRLFLETLGVTLISPWKVHFQGINPFPWSVKIKFRGLTITRGLENTTVVFPSGKVVEIKDPTPCTVSIGEHNANPT
jgi:hypothetical protein